MPEINLSITYFLRKIHHSLVALSDTEYILFSTILGGLCLAKPPKKAQKCENVDLNIS